MKTSFVSSPSISFFGLRVIRCQLGNKRISSRLNVRRRCVMIQRPDQDGPPDLEVFFDKRRKSEGSSGDPISLGTGRALLKNHENDSVKTSLAALTSAQDNFTEGPQLLHVTMSLDVNMHAAVEALRRETAIPLIGRSVNKKESQGTVEVLLLSSGDQKGITVASKTLPSPQNDSSSAKQAACEAAKEAVDRLSNQDSCTFMLFCHSPGDELAVRSGLNQAYPGIVAYGGPAVGDEVSGDGWALFGNESHRTEDAIDQQTVHVAAIPGSLSFLYSAVIKNWAQPAFTEPLSYMKATYVDDPHIDLLTAVRYDDWKKFLWCIEEQKVDVNTTWDEKQNQSPLLAACARARTEMIKYLLKNGADVNHCNDGGFTASMYTRMLADYDRDLILNQLKMLEEAGADTQLTEREKGMLQKATGGRIVE